MSADEEIAEDESKAPVVYDQEFETAILALVINYSLQKSYHMPMSEAKKEVAGYLKKVATSLLETNNTKQKSENT